jgi:hypothetical protein
MSGHARVSLRNSDYPQTFIRKILVSLEDPHHWVRLEWEGPKKDQQEVGPFHSSPGRGLKGMNCNDVKTSNTNDSRCTPKGSHFVDGFKQRLDDDHRAVYVTFLCS